MNSEHKQHVVSMGSWNCRICNKHFTSEELNYKAIISPNDYFIYIQEPKQ